MMKLSSIPKIKHQSSDNFFLIAGPCAIEGEKMAFRIAEKVVEISNNLQIPFIFKGSFKKANRSKLEDLLAKLVKIRKTINSFEN